MANRKNSHRRRVRVAVLMVLCGAVFAAFFARLAWMQFVRADYYADKRRGQLRQLHRDPARRARGHRGQRRGRSGPRHHRV